MRAVLTASVLAAGVLLGGTATAQAQPSDTYFCTEAFGNHDGLTYASGCIGAVPYEGPARVELFQGGRLQVWTCEYVKAEKQGDGSMIKDARGCEYNPSAGKWVSTH